jgi:hypothetical protein
MSFSSHYSRTLSAYVPPFAQQRYKDKVIPSEAYGAQRVVGGLRLPDCMTSALEGGRLPAVSTGRLYPQEYPGTQCKRLSRPRANGIVGYHGSIL